MKKIEKRLDHIEHILKVILCCVLVPKNGPNWEFYHELFKRVVKKQIENNQTDEPNLATMVQDIIDD